MFWTKSQIKPFFLGTIPNLHIGTHTVFDLHYRKTLWFTTTNGGLNPKIVVFPNLSTDEHRQYSARNMNVREWECAQKKRFIFIFIFIFLLLFFYNLSSSRKNSVKYIRWLPYVPFYIKNCFPTKTVPLPQKQNDLSVRFH